MSRVNAKSNNRCPVCGGRMRLVNVTWVDRFQAPEASLYDRSISRRKSLLPVSSKEMMCFSCSRRTPVSGAKLKKVKKVEKVEKIEKVEKRKVEKQDNKQDKKNKKKGGGSIFGHILFLAILAITIYLVVTYREIILAYLQLAINFVTGFFQK